MAGHRCNLVGANLVFALDCLNGKNGKLFLESPIDRGRNPYVPAPIINTMLFFQRLILFLLMTMLCSSAWADELIMGEVVSVDRENSEVVLRITGGQGSGVSDAAAADVRINVKDGQIPGGVRQGRIIRIWAKPETVGGKIFSADHISPGCRCDMTGVRGRLRKAGQGMHGRGGQGRGHGGRGGH